jgi:hypothetical protein
MATLPWSRPGRDRAGPWQPRGRSDLFRQHLPVRDIASPQTILTFALAFAKLGGDTSDKMFKLGMRSKRPWRPLTGVLVAYAVAAQSLLIALGGFAIPAHANADPAAFELCLHDAQGEGGLPAGTPDHSGCSPICLFCFAGSHHALIRLPPSLYQRVDVEIIDTLCMADDRGLPRLSAHSIASPRGPPLGRRRIG